MFQLKDIRLRSRRMQRKIKNFLLSERCREFLVFLFFFVISTGFWLLQTLKNDYETEISIPVRLKGIPNDVVITSPLPSQLRVQVKDKGTVLLNYLLGQTFYPVALEFDSYKGRGNHVRIYAKELEKKITGQLSSSTKLLAVRPDTLEFVYTREKAKVVPVRLKGNIAPNPLYYITDTVYSPDSVTVYAPQSILDTLDYVVTEFVSLTNLSDTTKCKLPIRQIKGAKYVPDRIELTLPTDIITEKTLEVPLVGTGFPSDKVLRTFPSKVRLTFQVGLNRFGTVHPEDFRLEVPYEELLHNESDKYRVKIVAQPSGVAHIHIIPEEVDYLIEQLNGND